VRVEIKGQKSAAMGRRDEAKAPILLALGNDGQQRAPAKNWFKSLSSRHIPKLSPLKFLGSRGFHYLPPLFGERSLVEGPHPTSHGLISKPAVAWGIGL